MLSPDKFSELRELLSQLCDADDSFEKMHRVEELIGDDEDAFTYYLHFMDLHGSLRHYAPSINENVPVSSESHYLKEKTPAPNIQSRSRFHTWIQPLVPWLLLAAVVGGVIAFGVPHQQKTPQKVTTLDQPLTSVLQPVVAQVTRATTDCYWGESEPSVFYGAHLREGNEVRLDRGLAEITFQNGVVVILEGPAVFEMLSHVKTRLHVGRLSAHVPEQAIGFTVLTPDAEVIDLGTEFGVRVDVEGHAEVHTFEGEVSLKVGDEESKRVAPIILNAGQALLIGQSEPRTQEVAFDEKAFPRQDFFESKLLSQENRAYRRWLTHSRELRKDNDLLVYYAFQHPTDVSSPILNCAASTAGTHDGQLGLVDEVQSAPSWIAGRWPEKGALRFDGSKQQVVTIEQSASIDIQSGLSISVWTKLINPLPVNLICSKWHDYAEPHEKYCFWLGTPSIVMNPDASTYIYGSRLVCQVSPNGKIAGFNEYKDESYSGVYTGPGDGWVHVAMTVDPSGEGEIHLYKNGYEIDHEVGVFGPDSIPLTSAPILLGGKVNRDDTNSFFDGLIDEFAIFRRALTAEEVLQMYEAGKPELTK